MKIDRLLEITVLLLNKGTVTARELAGRFGVSTRTIYRDIDVLSTAGVPVFTNKGSGGGISILEDFTFNRALITEHERDGLLLALKTLQVTKYPEIDSIIGKIGAVFRNAASADWVDVEFSPWGCGPDAGNRFTDIRRGILECRVITFDYISAESVKSRRRVEPMQMLFRGQAWYLWGYCRIRRDFRTFRLSRMRNLTVGDEKFTRRAPESVTGGKTGTMSKKSVTLKLRFQPEVLYRLYDEYDDDFLVKSPDGTIDVTFTCPEDDWVYGHIMSFGDNVEVLEPEHVRQIVRSRMEKALKYYDK